MKKKAGSDLNKQCVNITLVGLVGSAINGIIAYVAVYFFKPLWDKTISYFSKKNE